MLASILFVIYVPHLTDRVGIHSLFGCSFGYGDYSRSRLPYAGSGLTHIRDERAKSTTPWNSRGGAPLRH